MHEFPHGGEKGRSQAEFGPAAEVSRPDLLRALGLDHRFAAPRLVPGDRFRSGKSLRQHLKELIIEAIDSSAQFPELFVEWALHVGSLP